MPTTSGRVETAVSRGPINVTVNVNAPGAAEPAFMARSGRQVARAVTRALMQAERA